MKLNLIKLLNLITNLKSVQWTWEQYQEHKQHCKDAISQMQNVGNSTEQMAQCLQMCYGMQDEGGGRRTIRRKCYKITEI